MIIINGPATFEWRDHLRRAGGIWNAALRRWELPSMDADTIAMWRSRPGIVVITGADGQPAPRPQSIKHQTHTQFHQRIIERTNIFGDDPTYFNYFADQNPISYFGFSGLNMLMGFVDHMPQHIKDETANGRNDPWDIGGEWFSGVHTMDEAFDLARNGWHKGVDTANEIREKLVGSQATERRRRYSVAGGRVSVGRLLADNPKHMIHRPRQPGTKVVTLFLESSFLSDINSADVMLRAGVVAAAIDVLEMNGFSCEVVAVGCNKCGGAPGWQLVTTLKKAGQKFNINDMVFAIGHPAYFRRFAFAAMSFDEAQRQYWYGRGAACKSFYGSHQPKKNEFVIEQFRGKYLDQTAPLIEQARECWDIIIPKNFPINLTE